MNKQRLGTIFALGLLSVLLLIPSVSADIELVGFEGFEDQTVGIAASALDNTQSETGPFYVIANDATGAGSNIVATDRAAPGSSNSLKFDFPLTSNTDYKNVVFDFNNYLRMCEDGVANGIFEVDVNFESLVPFMAVQLGDGISGSSSVALASAGTTIGIRLNGAGTGFQAWSRSTTTTTTATIPTIVAAADTWYHFTFSELTCGSNTAEHFKFTVHDAVANTTGFVSIGASAGTLPKLSTAIFAVCRQDAAGPCIADDVWIDNIEISAQSPPEPPSALQAEVVEHLTGTGGGDTTGTSFTVEVIFPVSIDDPNQEDGDFVYEIQYVFDGSTIQTNDGIDGNDGNGFRQHIFQIGGPSVPAAPFTVKVRAAAGTLFGDYSCTVVVNSDEEDDIDNCGEVAELPGGTPSSSSLTNCFGCTSFPTSGPGSRPFGIDIGVVAEGLNISAVGVQVLIGLILMVVFSIWLYRGTQSYVIAILGAIMGLVLAVVIGLVPPWVVMVMVLCILVILGKMIFGSFTGGEES
jgi:hypothetical protein